MTTQTNEQTNKHKQTQTISNVKNYHCLTTTKSRNKIFDMLSKHTIVTWANGDKLSKYDMMNIQSKLYFNISVVARADDSNKTIDISLTAKNCLPDSKELSTRDILRLVYLVLPNKEDVHDVINNRPDKYSSNNNRKNIPPSQKSLPFI